MNSMFITKINTLTSNKSCKAVNGINSPVDDLSSFAVLLH